MWILGKRKCNKHMELRGRVGGFVTNSMETAHQSGFWSTTMRQKKTNVEARDVNLSRIHWKRLTKIWILEQICVEFDEGDHQNVELGDAKMQ